MTEMGRPRTGSIYEGDDGLLWAKITVDLPGGKTARKSYPLETPHRRVANLKLTQLRTRLEAGGMLPKQAT